MIGRTHNPPNKSSAAFTGIILLILPICQARSAEFCVTCYGPPAQYRCAVSQDGDLTAPPGAQLPCIKQLALQGGHKSCAVARQGAGECAGKLLIIKPDPATQLPPENPINKPTEALSPETPKGPLTEPAVEKQENAEQTDPDAAKQEGEPKTVVELAKRTAESSKKNINNAGKAVVDAAKSTGGHIKNAGKYVGSTAKKTWDCIISLFMKCGS